MTQITKIIAAFLIGTILYIICFTFLIHKPMSIGIKMEYFAAKRAYLEKIKNMKKVVILAGSNGRFSHRCEVIESYVPFPCANLSSVAGTDLYYDLAHYKEFIRPGDIIYMPLEYRFDSYESKWVVGSEGPLMIHYERNLLWEFEIGKIVGSFFYFDIRFLFSALGEMGLNIAGKKRRFGISTLTVQGDEKGHDSFHADPYREYVQNLPAMTLDSRALGSEKNWQDLIKILTWANEHGVLVVGGLPTIFDEIEIPETGLNSYKKIFTERGQKFLELKNRSQYPRYLFFDSGHHLQQEAQIQHSISVAKGLKDLLKFQ